MVGGQAVHGWQHALFGNDSTTEAGLRCATTTSTWACCIPQARVPFGDASDDHVDETLAGAYVQNATTWLPWLRTLAGVRDGPRRSWTSTHRHSPADGGQRRGNAVVAEVLAGLRARGRRPSSSPTPAAASTATTRAASSARGGTPDPVPALVGQQGRGAGPAHGDRARACRPRWPSGAWTATRSWSTPPTRAAPRPTAPAGAAASS